jgi:hypothetical protein
MVKRIKNFDKLNYTGVGFDGLIYQILTDKIIETDTESEYNFALYDLTKFELEGKLVITQATQTTLSTGKKEMVNEYVLKLRTRNSSNLVMQHILMEEIMMEFELFKRYLIECCQKMLRTIKEAKEWKVTNGYTT